MKSLTHSCRSEGTKLQRRFFVAGIAAFVASASVGCATMTRGGTEKLVIKSEPSDAIATIVETGVSCTTPCELELSRKMSFELQFELEGCETTSVRIVSGLSGGGTAAMLAGGLIGAPIDAATGANRSLTPNPVVASLHCAPQPPTVPQP